MLVLEQERGDIETMLWQASFRKEFIPADLVMRACDGRNSGHVLDNIEADDASVHARPRSDVQYEVCKVRWRAAGPHASDESSLLQLVEGVR